MFAAAENLQFETAARLRDDIRRLQAELGQGSESDARRALSSTRPAANSAKPARRGASAGRRRR